MKRIDKLNGLKSWWNSLCKPEYKITISAEELKLECISEFENFGFVEMRRIFANDNFTHHFWGNKVIT